MDQQPNKVLIGKDVICIAATDSGASMTSTKNVKLESVSGIKMTQNNPDGTTSQFDMQERFVALDATVDHNHNSESGAVNKVHESTTSVGSLENKFTVHNAGINAYANKHNTTDHSTSLHKAIRSDLNQTTADREAAVSAVDSSLSQELDNVRSDRLAQLSSSRGNMTTDRATGVAALAGANESKLFNDVTSDVNTETALWDTFLENCTLLCAPDTLNQLQQLNDDIAAADTATREQIRTFASETYSLVGEFRETVQQTTGVSATISTSSVQLSATPLIEGTLVMGANKKFFVFFNNVAFDITPAEDSGSHPWKLDFADTTDLTNKQVYLWQTPVVRSGSAAQSHGDQNEIVVVEYDVDETDGTLTLHAIAASQRLIIDTYGPTITQDVVMVPAEFSNLSSLTITGSANEVGVEVSLIEVTSTGSVGRTWKKTSDENGLYAFFPYFEAPLVGVALLVTSNDHSTTFRVSAKDARGLISTTSDFDVIIEGYDITVTNFTVDSGPNYTTRRPTFSGKVEAFAVVTSVFGGVSMSTGRVGSDGEWSITWPVDLPEDQVFNMVFEATDESHNSKQITQGVKIHTESPMFLSVSNDLLTNTRVNTYSGAITPAPGHQFGGVSSVDISVVSDGVDHSSTASIVMDTSGAFAATLNLPDLDAEYTVTYTATNNFGISATHAFVVGLDRTNPVVTVADKVLDSLESITMTGTWSDHGSSETPVIRATIGDVVYLANVMDAAGTLNSGTWGVDFKAAPDSGSAIVFAEGEYAVTAEIEDGAGNKTSASAMLEIDLSAPVIDLSATSLYQNVGNIELKVRILETSLKKVEIAGGGSTLDLTSAFSGKSDNTLVILSSGLSLSSGVHEVTVVVVDNYNKTTAAKIFITVDTTSPVVDGITPNVVETSDGAITFQGYSDEALATLTVAFATNAGSEFTEEQIVTVGAQADSSGKFPWSILATGVPYGTEVLMRTTAMDLAGNQSIHLEQVAHSELFIPVTLYVPYVTPPTVTYATDTSYLRGFVDQWDTIEYIEVFQFGETRRVNLSTMTVPIAGIGTPNAYANDNWREFYVNANMSDVNNTYVSGSFTVQAVNISTITVKQTGQAAVVLYTRTHTTEA